MIIVMQFALFQNYYFSESHKKELDNYESYAKMLKSQLEDAYKSRNDNLITNNTDLDNLKQNSKLFLQISTLENKIKELDNENFKLKKALSKAQSQTAETQIKLENNHHYTPDVLINNEFLVELKSRKNVQLYENKERFEMEQRSANEYCQKHNLSFQVVYDDEIGFETRKYKKFLKDNPDIIEKYQINFHKDIWS